MRKPILVIGLPSVYSQEAMQSINDIFDKHLELKKEYHVLVFDRTEKFEAHVLNGEYDDIKNIEDFMNELRND